MQTFWKIEEVEIKNHYTREENECEEHYVKTFRRDIDGRFEVSLPVKRELEQLGESETSAIKRFHSVEKRFERDPEYKKSYVNFMNEYIELGHMTAIDLKNDNVDIKCYLPHHGVLKESSTSTKLRVVYDASCPTSSGLSLNNVLKVGPTIQSELFSVILKFRKHNIVFIGDVKMMYRQINLNQTQRDLQRIIWRSDPNEELKHYCLNTVTYGTGPASFLACRSLIQIAYEYENKYPHASNVVKKDFYVDDLITGASSIAEALQLKNEIIEITESGKFPLRKWSSNCKELLETSDINSLPGYDISNDQTVKTLGLIWNPQNDSFTFTTEINYDRPVTKRIILSTISKIFDPLGLIGPVIVSAKLILQKLWDLQIDWDESVPMDLHTTWLHLCRQLPKINKINIPRQVTVPQGVEVQMHGFCDASEQAYGVAIYIRTTDSSGVHHSKLLCAKSKIAPLKKITLPRLELLGALLLSRLTRKVEESLDMGVLKKFYWCDSTITLDWIKSEPSNWKNFVANRTSEIRDLTNPHAWRHIEGASNPADIISRGSTPEQLSQNKLWWFGPIFLKNDISAWPNSCVKYKPDATERRKQTQLCVVSYNTQFIIERYSSFTKTHWVFTHVLRFIHNCNPKNCEKLSGKLTRIELNKSLNLLLKLCQASSFSTEIHALHTKVAVPKSSKILSLNPFLDSNGLLRVGGRIKYSNELFDRKHPIVLPDKNALTKQIIQYEHIRNLHAGAIATLNAVRARYWPINGRNAVRGIIQKCMICFRAKPPVVNPMMGNIPKARLVPKRPFSIVGVDYAGPILIKDSFLRSRKMVKSYICIFVCFITKAVHIELATSLSTEAFLNCLKRFVSRRGLCTDIHSDNGSNFVGADKELRTIINAINESANSGELRDFTLKNFIAWHFIPPLAPHQGGLWEAAVKSAKHHLTRIVGNTHLNYECLYTVLCQIEAILNSRPLTILSNDPNDLSALTPAHFLVGDSMMAVPQADVTEIPTNRLKLFQHLQQLLQHFWKRWSVEYITSLQQRTKWKSNTPTSVNVGSLVLLREENLPPLQWRLGRVVAIHPGKDSVVRVISVATKNGVVKRSVNKVSALPID